MAKFHVTPEGVLPCNDNTGRCPYLKGDKNNHFHDPAKAEAVFASRMVEENGMFSTVKNASSAPVINKSVLHSRFGAPVAVNSQQYRTASLFAGAKAGRKSTGFSTRARSGSATSSPSANIMAKALQNA